MKRIFAAVLLMSLLLAACNAPETTEKAMEESTAEAAESTEAASDTEKEAPYEIVLIDGDKALFTYVYQKDSDAAKDACKASGAEFKDRGIRVRFVSEGTEVSDTAVYLALGDKNAVTVSDGRVNITAKSENELSSVLACFWASCEDGFGRACIMSDESKEFTNAMMNVSPVVCAVKVPGLSREYSLLHLTDMHMCLVDEDTTQARKNYNAPRYTLFSKNGIYAEQRYPYFFEYARETGCDAMILTGDITDQPSDANIAAMTNQIENSSVPVCYTVGNHDWCYSDDYWSQNAISTHLPKFSQISGGNTDWNIWDFEEFVVLTVDNSMNSFKPVHIEALNHAIEMNKPIVLAMHIPLSCPELKEASKRVWGGRDITIGVGGVGDNDTSFAFIDLATAEDSPVVAILCGHVHFTHSENAGYTPQFVTGGGFDGICRILKLVPEDTE